MMELLDQEQCDRLCRYHADGRDWIERLPTVVARIARRWNLDLGPTFRPGGDASWAARVTRDDGSPAVLKIAFPDSASTDAVRLLRSLDGAGAVRLFEHDDTDDAFLFELCSPGTPAADVSLGSADEAAAAVLPVLWRLPTSGLPELPRLSALAAERATMLGRRADRLDDPFLREGADLYAALAGDESDVRVLHGDANQRNVLRSDRGWLAIDPRPMLGDPCYEVAAWCVTRLADTLDPTGWVTSLADRLDLPRSRTARWAAGQALMLCSWLGVSGEPGPVETYRSAAAALLRSAG